MSNKTKNILLGVLIVGVISMTIAFAALSTRLNINGEANVSATSWNVHFQEWSLDTNPTVDGHQNTAQYPIIEAIKKLSDIVGIDNLYIRYDPVFLSDTYTLDYHIKEFDKLCELLDGYVKHIIISFIDIYKNVKNNMKYLKIKPFTDDDYKSIGINFSNSAKKHNMSVQTCFEENNLVEYGFVKGDCLNIQMAYKLTGKDDYKLWKARKGGFCKCIEMVDIGEYNSCMHLCKYCYANYNEKIVCKKYEKNDPNSPFLIGIINNNDIIKIRRK